MKKSLLMIICCLMLPGLCACGANSAPAELDFEACSRELLDSETVFSDLLSPLPAETATALYLIEAADAAQAQVYCSTGATAEEIALFKAADEAAVGRIKAAVEARIASQKESYASYVPEEVPKLEEAIVRAEGLYVVYVTANDVEAAEKILDKHI